MPATQLLCLPYKVHNPCFHTPHPASPTMQRPTCTGLRVRTPYDAHIIFHAVSLDLLPMVSRRLDTEERRSISSGCVFVWEERGPNAEATGLGIERWTDSIRWGPSRVRDEFLYYHEKDAPGDRELTSDSEPTSPRPPHGFFRNNLIKQTYSVFVETSRGRRKWHMIAYFTQESLNYLRTIDDLPQLSSLNVPPGKYKTARSAKSGGTRSFDPTMSPPPYPSYGQDPLTVDDCRSSRSGHHQSNRLGPKSRSPQNAEVLAPLAYLQNIPPSRRHPLDERALMSFNPDLLRR